MVQRRVLENGSQDEIIREIHKVFNDNNIDYAFTGLTAVNLYGFGMGNRVVDIAVKNKRELLRTVKLFKCGLKGIINALIFDIHVESFNGYKIRFEPDLIDNSFINEDGIKIQNKELLLRRLEIYQDIDHSIGKATAFIALTKNEECIKKYKHIWNIL